MAKASYKVKAGGRIMVICVEMEGTTQQIAEALQTVRQALHPEPESASKTTRDTTPSISARERISRK